MPFFRPLTPPAPPMLTEATVTLFRLFIGGKKGNHHFLPRQDICDHRCNGHVPGIEGQINGLLAVLRRRG